MYFLYTLLQSLDCDADLNDPDFIDKLRVVGVEVATQMVTADKIIKVFGIANKLLRTENRTLWHRTVDSIGLGLLPFMLECLCPICQVRIEPVQHRSLDTKTSIKNFQQCFVVDRIERCAEIKLYEDRDFAGVDVAHELIVDGCDCSLGRVVGDGNKRSASMCSEKRAATTRSTVFEMKLKFEIGR